MIPVSVSFKKTRLICCRDFLLVLLNSPANGTCMSPFDVFVAERHSFRKPSWMKNVVSLDAALLVWLIWLWGLEGSLSKLPEFRSFTVHVEGGWWDTSTEKVSWSQWHTFKVWYSSCSFNISGDYFEWYVVDFCKFIYFNKFVFFILFSWIVKTTIIYPDNYLSKWVLTTFEFFLILLTLSFSSLPSKIFIEC